MTIFVSAADPKGDKIIKGKHQENVRIHVESTRGQLLSGLLSKKSFFLAKRAKSSVPAVYIQMISNQKQTGVLPGKDPCGGRHYALNYFEFYLQPVYRAASARFQPVLFFSASPLLFRTPFLFLASASRHLPMLRLRGRFKPFDAEPFA